MARTLSAAGSSPGFRALPAPRSLAHSLVERLASDITSGKFAPGARLPTEQEMIASLGVSRTVVREAVAALRAEGLVVTRQGVGAFVAASPGRPFRIETSDRYSLREIVEVMELRTGIEIEAAGLAAERASKPQLATITDAFAAIERAIASGEAGVDQDFAFHCSIAAATGNPQFVSFLEYLGRFIIPRQTIQSAELPAERRAYLRRIQDEHREILDALRSGQAAGARAAMQRHMLNSRKRYRGLAEREVQTP
ncbi:MAG: FadR family transcriptional regulator [Xanthobacteraceae bacterium]|nr:FadR family transcriptional regulator [Xanthobacteraceae bacterium]